MEISNAAAIGYAILAAKKLGLNKDELQHLETIMRGYMDLVDPNEAEDIYHKN